LAILLPPSAIDMPRRADRTAARVVGRTYRGPRATKPNRSKARWIWNADALLLQAGLDSDPAGRTAGRDMPAGHLPAGARRVLKAAHVIHSSALGACAELVGRLARPLADLPPRAPAGGARRDKSRGVE
jgi:hypothetical protein